MKKKVSSSTIVIIILSTLLVFATSYIVFENLNSKEQNDNDNQIENSEKNQPGVSNEEEKTSVEGKKLNSILDKIKNESSVQKVTLSIVREQNGAPVTQTKEATKKIETLVKEIIRKVLNNSSVSPLPDGIGFTNSDSISIYYTDSNNQSKEMVILSASDSVAIFDYRNKYNNELDNTFYVKLNAPLFDYIGQKYFD